MEAVTASLFDVDPDLPPGFLYRPGFLAEEEERQLLTHIQQVSFSDVHMHGVIARRRVVQYGWRYGFDERQIEAGQDIPDFLRPFRERAARLAGCQPADFREALITEYRPGAPIGWHRDAPMFGVIAGISLAAACRFRLRPMPGREGRDLTIQLQPRSAYVLSGEARSEWQHHIPPVPALRYSITFRTLRSGKGRGTKVHRTENPGPQ